jgi:hypothetical protein
VANKAPDAPGAEGGEWKRHPSSYRDENGTLGTADGRLVRRLSPDGWANWQRFRQHPVSRSLMARGIIVDTWEEDPAHRCLGHAPVETVSYPGEWPFTLLKLAAFRQLELLTALLENGFTLRDGKATNVLFQGMRPVFADIGSIAPFDDQAAALWPGLQQFLESALYPLALCAIKGVPFNDWLRGRDHDGLPTAHVSRLISPIESRKAGLWKYLKLKRMLDVLWDEGPPVGRPPRRTAGGPRAALRMVEDLRRNLEKLTYKPQGGWTDYKAAAYEDSSAAKLDAVERVLADASRDWRFLWDVGCNDGRYALLARRFAKYTICLDAEPAVVDEVAKMAHATGSAQLHPLVVDFTRMSSGGGWQGLEFPRVDRRLPPDCLLALAVVHHIVISQGVPMELLLDHLASVSPLCVVEFVDPADPMAEHLSGALEVGHHRLPDARVFRALLDRRFNVLVERPTSPTRGIFLLETRHFQRDFQSA